MQASAGQRRNAEKHGSKAVGFKQFREDALVAAQ
jgi:hypothetical protein